MRSECVSSTWSPTPTTGSRVPPVSGPAGIMALVLAETSAGAAAFLFLTPLWSEVRRGFFYLTGSIVLVLAGATAAAGAAGHDAGSASEGRLAVVLALALAGMTLVWLALMLGGLRIVARVLGIASVPLAVAMLFAFARTADESVVSAFFQLLTGAVFTGAVLDGLLLGHWYLTDRRLTRGPINRMAWLLIAAVVFEIVGVSVGGATAGGGNAASNSLNPILTLAGSATWIAVGMVLCTGLIAVLIRLTLRGTRPQAVQSATGFFYLAVITAFTAELASKVRFLP
jgi:hypothetical protein